MRIVAILVLALAVESAEGAEPQLTKEMGVKVQAGIGKLKGEDLLKLFPGPVRVVGFPQGIEADLILKWEEVASIEVVLIGGKVSSATAEFNDTVVSKTLTLDGFKQIKSGMTQAEVEKVLGRPNSFKSDFKDNDGQAVGKCRWSQGRRVFAHIKDGKVSGGGFMEGKFP